MTMSMLWVGGGWGWGELWTHLRLLFCRAGLAQCGVAGWRMDQVFAAAAVVALTAAAVVVLTAAAAGCPDNCLD